MEDKILLDHGAGGALSQQLITEVIAAGLGEIYTGEMEDSARVPVGTSQIAITTDSFVIDPIFFGNGDIGKVAVAGTVNDLAVSGARPLYLTLALVLEEGFLVSDISRIVRSVRDTARQADVTVVAGDTKVVRSGEADGVFLNTSGVGVFERPGRLSSTLLQPGDRLIVTGYLGDHSIHILSLREGLGFEHRIPSDCAVLNRPIAAALDVVPEQIRCIRDITRGGLGTVLNELARASDCTIELIAESLPIRSETSMAADMLGVDVMYLANEGNLCLAVSPAATASVLKALHGHPETERAAVVGTVTEAGTADVLISDRQGRRRRIDLLAGAQLPRLC